MPEEKIKLTPMRLLALNLAIKKPIYPGYLAYKWASINNQQLGVASRWRFGNTSAAYKRLRELSEAGLLKLWDKRDYCYTITEAGEKRFHEEFKGHVKEWVKNKLKPFIGQPFNRKIIEDVAMEALKYFCMPDEYQGEQIIVEILNEKQP